MKTVRTPLAAKNLLHQPRRTLVSVTGVTLAVVLMFMQLGFLGAIGDTATVVYQKVPMDLVVRSPDYLHLLEPGSIDQSLTFSLAALAEVADVRPLDAALAPWRNPQTHETRAIAVLGIDPPRPAIITDETVARARRLTSPEFVLIDRASRAEFGPAEGDTFGPRDVGQMAEVNNRRVRIVGTFFMGTGLAASGALITSRQGFQRIVPGEHAGRASMLLLRLRPGISAREGQRAVAAKLRDRGFGALQVLTREEALARERKRWYWETPIGLIFAMGVALAFVVGGVLCYMVLAAEVIAHLSEYATLKAMGYSNAFLGRTLIHQALVFATLAMLPGLGIAWILYGITGDMADIPIRMTFQRVVLVSLLSTAMCMAAGVLALRKLTKAEPASLF